jgi:hypothetical protein
MATVTGKVVIGGVQYNPTATITLPVVPTGFPNASNTGYTGTLTNYTGPSRITAANTLIENKRITVPLVIVAGANNVTIRNCLIRAGGYWLVLNDEGATGLKIIDTELDGTPNAPSSGDAAVAGDNYTLTRCNVHHTVDGLKAGDNVVIEDSYIHDMLIAGADPHNDGIQSLGTNSLTIRRNTIIVKAGSTSAIILSTGSASAMKNVLIQGNLLAGGAFTVYGGYQAGTDTLSKVSNIRILDNKFSTQIYPNSGAYGPLTSTSSPVVVTGNTWYDGPKVGQTVS